MSKKPVKSLEEISPELKEKVNELLVKPVISVNEQRDALQSSLFALSRSQPFYAGMLQEMSFKYSNWIPTAGLIYDKKKAEFEIHLSPEFFVKNLNDAERVAVLTHEILHFTHQHILRSGLETMGKDQTVFNIAADMAINQYIKDLPEGCVSIKDWKQKDGSVFPDYKSMEEYISLLEENMENENNKGAKKSYVPGEGSNDVHNWEELSEDEKDQMAREAAKIVKRTIEKTVNGYDKASDFMKDLLERMEANITKLDAKKILANAIKKTTSSANRESTWTKPNRRYGSYAPGTQMGKLPKLAMYGDSSGSIGVRELNGFFEVINDFLKVGARTCRLMLWHTDVYYDEKYKLHSHIEPAMLESGGTDIGCVMAHIKKTKPDLAIVLTDGYYSPSDIEVGTEVIFVVTGDINHPMKHVGKTIKLSGIVS